MQPVNVRSSERLQSDLTEHGVKVGVHRIKYIRKEHGIRCKQVKDFKATTNSNHALPVAENGLDQKFEVNAPNQAWVADLTYTATDADWRHLAGHKDPVTGGIVDYATDNGLT